MAKRLLWNSNFTTDDLVINWEDDVYAGFPFFQLKPGGLAMRNLDSLVAPQENMVRGIEGGAIGGHSLDGFSSGKLLGLKGSLKYGWDRTSWPIPFITIDDKDQIFDRRHTFRTLKSLKAECSNISNIPTAEYVRIKSQVGDIINTFSDRSIVMMASMWGNVYGPISDDTKDHQFIGAIVKILRLEEKRYDDPVHNLFTKSVIANIFQYMGGEDRYPGDKRTQTRIINAVYDRVLDVKKIDSGIPCINSNLESFHDYITKSPDWDAHDKGNDTTLYLNYVISNNTYHITDIVRKLMMKVCKEELNTKDGRPVRTTKVLLYNEKQSNQAREIEKSRRNFEKEFASLFYTIRDSVLLPVKDILKDDMIPKKKLSDFNLEVFAMNQIKGEQEPKELVFDKYD